MTFNTVEFAVHGIPYAIDFGNPAPDAELTSVGAENFEWVVEESAKWLCCCKKTKAWKMNHMGNFYERRSNSEINFQETDASRRSPRRSGETSMSFKKRGGFILPPFRYENCMTSGRNCF
jgi:hypothetical protein